MHPIVLLLVAFGFAAAFGLLTYVFARRFLQLERNVAMLAANMSKPNSATDAIVNGIACGECVSDYDIREALRNEIRCRGEKGDHVSHADLMQAMKDHERKRAEISRKRNDDEYHGPKKYMPELMVEESGKIMPKLRMLSLGSRYA